MTPDTKCSTPAPCEKCKGTGSYAYDENHGKICEVCCRHTGRHVNDTGKEDYDYLHNVCADGCGEKLPETVPGKSLKESLAEPPSPTPVEEKAGWEERYDRIFQHSLGCNGTGDCDCNVNEVKSFIRSLLLSREREVATRLMTAKYPANCWERALEGNYDDAWEAGWEDRQAAFDRTCSELGIDIKK